MRRDVTDPSIEVTAAHVDAAKETIILERRTHIDSLVARLREEPVRRILAPMLTGGTTEADVLDFWREDGHLSAEAFGPPENSAPPTPPDAVSGSAPSTGWGSTRAG